MSNKALSKVARIENRFIFHAQYQLTAREQKVILYLIANINPHEQERFHEQIIPVKELEVVLKADGRKWGGLYEEMKQFQKRIVKKGIEFPTNVKIDGKPFPGYINWFQSVAPVENSRGEVCLRFLFAEDLTPFLLQLNEYAQINRLEAAPMRSGHAIRLFQIFKAQRDRMRRHEKVSRLTYGVEELKAILGIPGKYKRFNSFRERVLDTATVEINKYTSLNLLSVDYIRNSRRQVTDLTFVFAEKNKAEEAETNAPINKKTTYTGNLPKDFMPTSSLLNQTFSRSQLRTYKILIAKGIKEGIAFKQIIPKITGSEFEGFEDYYIEEALAIFESKTKLRKNQKAQKAGAFVKWFLKKEVFNQGENFARITEKVHERKKKLLQFDTDHWEERMASKGLTVAELEAQ